MNFGSEVRASQRGRGTFSRVRRRVESRERNMTTNALFTHTHAKKENSNSNPQQLHCYKQDAIHMHTHSEKMRQIPDDRDN